MIIGVSGKRGTGKDTLAAILVERGFQKVSFAKPLKAHVRQFFSMTEEHTDGSLKEIVDPRYGLSPRQIMIDVGQFYRRYDPLFWVKQAFRDLPTLAAISDVRFINEADYIRKEGGIVVRLERKPELNIYKGVLTDVSETQLDNYAFDEVFGEEVNITPADLRRFADSLEAKYNFKGAATNENLH
jgi:hypothetical protein